MKSILIIITALALSACSTTDFYTDAEKFNRASAMYCDEDGARAFMVHSNNIFLVCKNGSRFTVNGKL